MGSVKGPDSPEEEQVRDRIKTVAVAAVVSALTVAGLAVAQSDDGGSQRGEDKSEVRLRPPGPPPGGGFMIGGPGGRELTYSETHLRKDGKDVTVRADKGKVVSTSDDSISIERNDGETVEVAVDGDTKVLAGPRKGDDAKVGDIADGKQVVVVREDGDDAAEAVLVEPKNRLKLRHRLGGPPPGAPGAMPEPPSFDQRQD